MKRKIAILLIVALILSFIPAIVVNAADTTVVYQKISSMDELTTGKYVMVLSSGHAPKTYSSGWVLVGQPTISGNTITEANAAGYIWDLSVDGSNVTLTDANGVSIKPKGTSSNGITSGTFTWVASCSSGTFKFTGSDSYSGMVLAANKQSSYQIRAYKTSTATSETSYPSAFTLYKMTEVSSTDPTEAPTEEPTEAPTDPPVPTYDGTFYKLTAANQLTTGKYVMVLTADYAMTVYDSSKWVLSEALTVSSDSIANPAQTLVWDITVTDGTATLTDSNGVTITPTSTSSASIGSGAHSWTVVYSDGTFQFVGSGDYSAFTLAANAGSSYKLRAYKSSTVSSNANGYPSFFTLYRLVEEGAELPTTPPTEPTEAPTEEPTEAPTEAPVPTYNGTFYKLTAENQLTTGKYVMVLTAGYAPTVLESNWVLSEAFTPAGDSIANPAQTLVWDITVTDGTATLTDSNGVTITPTSTSSASIGTGAHNWTVVYSDGTFQFVGSGDYSAFTLAANSGSSYKLRAYKSTTVSDNANGYPSFFTLYRLVEEGAELPTTPPTEPTEPTEAPTEAPTVAPTDPVGDITYAYTDAGSYTDVIINWGTRDEVATQLSPNAIAFYNANNTSYGVLSALSGSSTTASVPGSALYAALNTLMVSNHDTITSYDDIKDLAPVTDAQKSGAINMTCFYSGEDLGTTWDSSVWNREHIWPKSKTPNESTVNGNADIMTLRPSNPSINSSRSNKAFGLVTDTSYYYPNNNTTEHDVRGDAARMLLYSYVRWDGYDAYMWGSSGVIESVDVLLTWIEADPVDTWEMGRNDSVESITGTRNVFVDYPELAFVLFGEEIPTTMTTPSGNAAGQTPTDPTDPTDPTEPATEPTEPAVSSGYQKITSMDQLTSGKYVMVVSNGAAMTVYDSTNWVLAGNPTIDGDTITTANAEGFIWNLTVDGTTVKLQDANGVFIKPKAGNNNGMQTGEYSWDVVCTDGTFRFNGVGSDTTSLAYNNTSGNYKFRSYKTTTISGAPNSYLCNFTLYKLVEETSDEPDTILVGTSYSIHLIEPWALRTNIQFAKNTADNLIPVSEFTAYGAYAIIGDKFDGTTAEELMADPDAVKYTSALGNIKPDGETALTFDFYDGLYAYNLGETVYWVAYYETADGSYYTEVIEKSLVGVADELLGSSEVSESEKAILGSMKTLKDAVIEFRGEDAVLGAEYPEGNTVANSGITFGAGGSADKYKFGTSYRIRLIEPWSVNVTLRVLDVAANGILDYNAANVDYGMIFYHDKAGTYDSMSVEQIIAAEGATVYSKSKGTASIVAGHINAVYDKGIYTYDLDSNLYCVPFVIVDGQIYYCPAVLTWNLLAEMQSFAQNTELDAKEVAVFEAMLALHKNTVNYYETID